MYDLRRLRAFHAVAEAGSFSAAGLELGYAQSVVSHHVAALERELGLTLINRATRPVSVTDAGARLALHAESVLGLVAAADDEMRALAGLQAGSLRVGAFLSACNSFLPVALARFESAHPDVEVDVKQLEEPDAIRLLRAGELDLAVVWRIPGLQSTGSVKDSFEEAHLADDPYRVVLSQSHPLSRRRQIRLTDLVDERFVAPPTEGHGRPYRKMLDRLFAKAGIEPRIQEVADVTVGRAMIGAGLSVGLLSELTMREPHTDVTLLPLRDLDPVRTLHAIWLQARRVPAASRMVEYLVDAARARLGSPAT